VVAASAAASVSQLVQSRNLGFGLFECPPNLFDVDGIARVVHRFVRQEVRVHSYYGIAFIESFGSAHGVVSTKSRYQDD
jgi:hypothetical protein